MAQQIINLGTAPNDGTGDPNRTAFNKSNLNFTELYNRPLGNAYTASSTAPSSPGAGDFWYDLSLGVLSIYVNDGSSSQWVMVSPAGGAGYIGETPHCGRLEFVSTTQLSFKPCYGDRIKINGVIYPIPSAGIIGLGTTGVFVNGVAGQNLVAGVLYLVTAFNNAGTITACFWTGAGHVTSTTAGNVGVEILSGNNGFTLVGMVRTMTGPTFQNDSAQRMVISWFNRRNLSLVGVSVSASSASTSNVELGGAANRVYFVSWGDEASNAGMHGYMYLSVANWLNCTVMLDGVTGIVTNSATSAAAGYLLGVGGYGSTMPAEGFHYLAPYGTVSGGTGTYNFTVTGMIRG